MRFFNVDSRLLGMVGGLGLLQLSGCVFFPHHDHRYPQISGIVRRDGVPWSGAEAVLSYEGSDQKKLPEQIVTASGEGFFVFKPSRELRFFLTLGDRFDSWKICFEQALHRFSCWQGHGIWGGPGEERLVCDVNRNAAGVYPEELPERSQDDGTSGCTLSAP